MSWKGMSGPRGAGGISPTPLGEEWLDWGTETKMRFPKYLPVGRDIKPVCTYKLVVSEDYDLGRTVNLLFFMDERGDEMNNSADFRFNSGTILVMQEAEL